MNGSWIQPSNRDRAASRAGAPDDRQERGALLGGDPTHAGQLGDVFEALVDGLLLAGVVRVVGDHLGRLREPFEIGKVAHRGVLIREESVGEVAFPAAPQASRPGGWTRGNDIKRAGGVKGESRPPQRSIFSLGSDSLSFLAPSSVTLVPCR